jgi:drug/metabolite transporter (DMT)-like permease
MNAHLAMVLAALLWASAAVASKAALPIVPFAELAFLRVALGSCVQWTAVKAFGLRAVPPRIALRAAAIGAVEPGIVTVIGYWGLAQTSAVHAVVIFSLMPITTAVLARLFIGEPLKLRLVAGAAVAIAATLALVTGRSAGAEASLAGDALVAIALVLACAAALGLRRNAQANPGSAVASTAYQLAGAATSSLAISFVAAGGTPFGWVGTADAATVATVLFLGLGVSGLASPIYNFAFKRLEAARVTLYVTLTNPAGVLLAWLFLGETLSLRDVGLIAVIVAGVALPTVIEARARVRARG